MGSKIVAIRHAKPQLDGFFEDALRPLCEEGRKIHKEMTERLKQEGIVPEKILASPLLRAQQTAQIMADAFGIQVEEEQALGYAFDAQALIQQASSLEGTLFLVGHAPTLGDFVNALVGQRVLPQGLCKSGAALVAFEQGIELGKGTFCHYYEP